MTVKEYLEIYSSKDIESIGIYKSNNNEPGADVLNTHVEPVDLIKYLDYEIDYVHLGIFDENRQDIYGKDYNAKYIRACIYVKGD